MKPWGKSAFIFSSSVVRCGCFCLLMHEPELFKLRTESTMWGVDNSGPADMYGASWVKLVLDAAATQIHVKWLAPAINIYRCSTVQTQGENLLTLQRIKCLRLGYCVPDEPASQLHTHTHIYIDANVQTCLTSWQGDDASWVVVLFNTAEQSQYAFGSDRL